ncbi:MAG: OmpA family protein [Candidatus Margulisiibacteriota bacterium]
MKYRNKRKGRPEESHTSEDEFSTVYGDVMSFMMMLFLMLYVLVSQNIGQSDSAQRALEKIKESLNRQTKQEITIKEKETRENELKKYILIEKIKEYISKENIETFVDVKEKARDKITITLKQQVLFPSGKAELKMQYKGLLSQIGYILAETDKPIVIEGHTDNVPIHTKEFQSNWELSFFRANNVMRYFINEHNLDPQRFAAIGYGEYQPLDTNDTPEGRANNRRIEISILYNDDKI